MQFKRFLLSGLFIGLLLLGFSTQPAGSHVDPPYNRTSQLANPKPLVQEMIDQVNETEVQKLTGDLSGAWPVTIGGALHTITTRHSLSGDSIQLAAQYLFEYYASLGLRVSLQDFAFQDITLSNVVAEKTGSVFPERVFLVTSHYDNMPAIGAAPGADDNASGTVGVMLAAKILSQYDFGCTLRFVNFAAEEQGLYGSSAYTHRAYCERQEQRGVLNLDMIAWNTLQSQSEVELHANPAVAGSMEIADLFSQVVNMYNLDLIPSLAASPTFASDHARFWAFDIPAILVIEDFSDFNPFYHSSNDNLGNIPDLAYYTEMIRASLATLAHMGCLVEDDWGSVTGTVTDLESGDPIDGAQIFLLNPAWEYTFQTTAAEDGTFTIPALAGEHQLVADALQFAPSSTLTITILPRGTINRELVLKPVREQQRFLPIASNQALAPLQGCP